MLAVPLLREVPYAVLGSCCSVFWEADVKSMNTVSDQRGFAPGLIREWFVDTSKELQSHVCSCSGDFGRCLAPAWVPWMLLKNVVSFVPLENWVMAKSWEGVFSSREARACEQSQRHRDAEAEQHLQEAPSGLEVDFAQQLVFSKVPVN